MALPSFQTTFNVPLSCQSCVDSVSQSLFKLEGISKVEADIPSQLITIEGSAAPSAIVAAIQSTGRDAILRGSGASNSTCTPFPPTHPAPPVSKLPTPSRMALEADPEGAGAAVAILETHAPGVRDKVRGLARMVQVSATTTVFDVSVRGVSAGRYGATVRACGDIGRGAASTGDVWEADAARREGGRPRADLGALDVGPGGLGGVFLSRPIQVWEMIGRALVVARLPEAGLDGADPDTLVGVIARSAGVWDNSKTVCSCSGKTVWEERSEQVEKGML